VWGILWIGWNAFVICFYLSVGVLDKVSVILIPSNTGLFFKASPFPDRFFVAFYQKCSPILEV
jgi:hypothetical protein